jgi:excisionase family DNA binding protein
MPTKSEIKSDELLSLSETARILNRSKDSVRQWADSGRLPVTWAGGARTFARRDVEAAAAKGVRS